MCANSLLPMTLRCWWVRMRQRRQLLALLAMTSRPLKRLLWVTWAMRTGCSSSRQAVLGLWGVSMRMALEWLLSLSSFQSRIELSLFLRFSEGDSLSICRAIFFSCLVSLFLRLCVYLDRRVTLKMVSSSFLFWPSSQYFQKACISFSWRTSVLDRAFLQSCSIFLRRVTFSCRSQACLTIFSSLRGASIRGLLLMLKLSSFQRQTTWSSLWYSFQFRCTFSGRIPQHCRLVVSTSAACGPARKQMSIWLYSKLALHLCNFRSLTWGRAIGLKNSLKLHSLPSALVRSRYAGQISSFLSPDAKILAWYILSNWLGTSPFLRLISSGRGGARGEEGARARAWRQERSERVALWRKWRQAVRKDLSLGVWAMEQAAQGSMRMRLAAQRCVESQRWRALRSLQAATRWRRLRMCLRHLGSFCMFSAFTSSSSMFRRSLRGIRNLLWLIARRRIDFGIAWWPFFFVATSSSPRNFPISAARSSTNLLKLRCRWPYYIYNSNYYRAHLHPPHPHPPTPHSPTPQHRISGMRQWSGESSKNLAAVALEGVGLAGNAGGLLPLLPGVESVDEDVVVLGVELDAFAAAEVLLVLPGDLYLPLRPVLEAPAVAAAALPRLRRAAELDAFAGPARFGSLGGEGGGRGRVGAAFLVAVDEFVGGVQVELDLFGVCIVADLLVRFENPLAVIHRRIYKWAYYWKPQYWSLLQPAGRRAGKAERGRYVGEGAGSGRGSELKLGNYFYQIKIKMSIEYQLYAMSFTNHIIIPIVGSRQNLEEQNIFLPTYYSVTPQKDDNLSELIFWKKSMSAFKKFKEKRDKRDRKNNAHPDLQDHDFPQPKKQYIHLLRKNPKDPAPYSQLKLIEYLDPPFAYYDPNHAPLYEFDLNDPAPPHPHPPKPPHALPRPDPEPTEIKIQRRESSLGDEEIPHEVIIEPKFDDPFIIIRKQNIKKSSKTPKTKHIKKERPQKPKEKTLSPEEAAKKQESKHKNAGETGASGTAMRQAESEEGSSCSEESGQCPKTKKEICTLEQLMKEARANEEGRQARREMGVKSEEKSNNKPIQ